MTPSDIRCKHCRTLLARRESDGLTIRRGDLQAVIAGSFTAAVSCYRCKTLNMVRESAR